jgi:hypothetical protein
MDSIDSRSPVSVAPARAIAGLLVNIIVLPGLGTLISGDLKRRRMGLIQLSLMMLIGLAMLTSPAWAPTDPEAVRGKLVYGVYALAIWATLTSVLIIREAWTNDRKQSSYI